MRRSERGEGEGQRLTAFLGLDRDKRHLKVWGYETNDDTHTHIHAPSLVVSIPIKEKPVRLFVCLFGVKPENLYFAPSV